MRIRTTRLGADQPFERDRRLRLRCIPVGARIGTATATITPVSTDAAGQFVEVIGFGGEQPDWGAFKRRTNAAVELDLRGRRQLVSVAGSNLDGSSLLVDLGGGFTGVDADGGLAGTDFDMDGDAVELPALTVTGVRFADSGGVGPGPDVADLRVASPPSNVSVAIASGPAFWTHFGDLVQPVTSADFAVVLQDALDASEVEHGHHVVELTVHSDSIARLDIELDIDVEIETSAHAGDVRRTSIPYSHGAVSDAAAGALTIDVPAGSIAVPGSTSGRVQGAFEATEVVHGPVGDVAVAGASIVDPDSSHAQPFRVDAITLASSVDVFVSSVTATAEIAVDIVEDLDGKPGQTSLLARPATRVITRDDAADLTWLNVGLPTEIEFAPGTRRWLILHASSGEVEWATGGPTPDGVATEPPLQVTADGGLSWRATGPDARGAYLRLRAASATFHMPVELQVKAGDETVSVDLARFEQSGHIDFALDFPDVAAAINGALASADSTASTAEHIVNGDFDQWVRSGATPRVRPPFVVGGGVPAFSADGATTYLATASEFIALDTYCGTETLAVELVDGPSDSFLPEPHTVIVQPSGSLALIVADTATFDLAALAPAAAFSSSHMTLVDLVAGRVVGSPLSTGRSLLGMAAAADGTGIVTLHSATDDGHLVRTSWSQLRAAAGGTPIAEHGPSLALGEAVTAMTVGPDGVVYVATTDDGARPAIAVFEPSLGADSHMRTVPTPFGVGESIDHMVNTSGGSIAAISGLDVAVLDPSTGRARRRASLQQHARSLASDPHDDVVWIVSDVVTRLDVGTGVVDEPLAFSNPRQAAITPSGSRLVVTTVDVSLAHFIGLGADVLEDWELTAGLVRPECGGADHRAMAVLGATTSDNQPVVDSAMSQVVPVDPGGRYRFSFAASAGIDGARAELLWRTHDCGADRVDVVPIDASDDLDRLRNYEHVATAPAAAVAVEVRFHNAEGEMYIDAVSLAGTGEALSNSAMQVEAGTLDGWDRTGGSVSTATGDEVGTVLSGASGAARLEQIVPVDGQRFRLAATVQATSDIVGSALSVEFADSLGQAVGDAVHIPVDRQTFDRYLADGDAPGGAAEARLIIDVPTGAAVIVGDASLSFQDPIPVTLDFISDAPGELVVSDVTVGLDVAEPQRPPIPENGLCPPTPPYSKPGSTPTSCHCADCGTRAPVVKPTAIVSSSGRPARRTDCPECGSTRLSLGGRPVAGARPVPPAGAFVVRSSGPRRAVVRALRPPAAPPITAVSGIGEVRSAELADRGIVSLADLVAADPVVVAELPLVSRDLALDFIAQAGDLLRPSTPTGPTLFAR